MGHVGSWESASDLSGASSDARPRLQAERLRECKRALDEASRLVLGIGLGGTGLATLMLGGTRTNVVSRSALTCVGGSLWEHTPILATCDRLGSVVSDRRSALLKRASLEAVQGDLGPFCTRFLQRRTAAFAESASEGCMGKRGGLGVSKLHHFRLEYLEALAARQRVLPLTGEPCTFLGPLPPRGMRRLLPGMRAARLMRSPAPHLLNESVGSRFALASMAGLYRSEQAIVAWLMARCDTLV